MNGTPMTAAEALRLHSTIPGPDARDLDAAFDALLRRLRWLGAPHECAVLVAPSRRARPARDAA